MVRRFATGRVFFGWYIVSGGIVVQILLGGLVMHATGFYVAALQEEFMWSATLFGLALAMTRIESGALGPVQGWAIDRYGPRMMMRLGIASTALGLILFGFINNQATFFIYYFIISIGAGVGGFMTLTVAVVHWFQRTRARAMGYLMTGLAIGSFLAPLISFLIDGVGWRATSIGSGVLLFIVGQVIATLIVRPIDRGASPEPARAATVARPDAPVAPVQQRRDFTTREALRTRSFWALSFAHGSPLLMVAAVSGFFVLRVGEIEGLGPGHAAIAIVIGTVCQIVAQLVGGYAGDVISKRVIIAMCLAGHAAAAIVLAIADSFPMIILGAVLHWTAWGGRGPNINTLRADYFGPANIGQIMGWASVVMMIYSAGGSLLTGALRDLSDGWALPFVVAGIGTASGLVWLALATRPRLPDEPADVDEPEGTMSYPQARS
ncbi:MAG: MFS transporter [Chloroflexi bacterium]|nr:MFS transporter [Chloroflexota bacterium]MYJ92632.1 MFS transporter [Chloroflexota bacterium]